MPEGPALSNPRIMVEGASREEEPDVEDGATDPKASKPIKNSRRSQDIKASEMPFHDFMLASKQKSFGQAVEAVKEGKVLVTRLYDAVDSFEAEAAF